MTRKSVTDEQYGRLHRRLGELARRVDQGSVDFDSTMTALQLLVEGKRLIEQPLSESEGHQSRDGQPSDEPIDVFDYFTPLADTNVSAEHQATLAKYRRLAEEYGVAESVPLCYRVRAGFTLKRHAPQAGPCYKDFQYLQYWNFENKPTTDCLVFWVPRLVKDSISKTADEQRKLLAKLRQRLELPEKHLSGFGEVSLVAGLVLAHFKVTCERTPLDALFARSDTCYAGSDRLILTFGEYGLRCGNWGLGPERRNLLGVFALGVELL